MMNLSKRKEALDNLISMNGNIDNLCQEVQEHGSEWNEDKAITFLKVENIRHILEGYISGQWNEDDLYKWADAIEMRDDIEYQHQRESDIADIISFLANREINGSTSKAQAESWLKDL